MQALVTGASGFIGSTLIAQLNQRGVGVRALMRKSSSPSNLQGLRYEVCEGHLGDLESLKRAVRGVDYVFHLAGVISGRCREDYFTPNATGTSFLAQAALETAPNLKRFVYVSSLAAAGPASSLKPREEHEAEQPVSWYGESKLGGERELEKFKSRLPYSVIRPPLVYGPKDRGVFTFFKTVSRNLMPIMRGAGPEGKKFYSAVHSSDLVEGILASALCDAASQVSGEVYYVTGDGVHSYEDLMGHIARALGKRPLKFPLPTSVLKVAAQAAGAWSSLTGQATQLNNDKLNELLPDYWICSNAKAKRVLALRPRYDLESGMRDTAEWYKSKGWL